MINTTNIADMTMSTLYELGRLRFQQIAQELAEYTIFSRWFKKGKVVFENSGIGIQRTLMDRTNKVAVHRGLTDVDTINFGDHLRQLKVPWIHADTHWAFLKQEMLQNRGKEVIIKVMQPKRAGAMIDLAQEIEDKAWVAPGVADTHLPFSIPFWVVKNATEGFNGGLPSGHTTLGGIDPAVTPTFKNYTGTFSDYTRTGTNAVIPLMKRAHRKMRFRSPVTIKDFRGAQGDRYQIYTDGDTADTFEEIAEAGNDSLGYDLSPSGTERRTRGSGGVRFVDETVTFKKHPIIPVDKLDDDSQNPIYMIDHSTFYPVGHKPMWLKEHSPTQSSENHLMMVVFVDIDYNFICVDRRRNAVLYKV